MIMKQGMNIKMVLDTGLIRSTPIVFRYSRSVAFLLGILKSLGVRMIKTRIPALNPTTVEYSRFEDTIGPKIPVIALVMITESRNNNGNATINTI